MSAWIEAAHAQAGIPATADAPLRAWARRPDRTVASDLRGRELTAGELDTAAAALAAQLDALSAPDGLVAVALPHRLEALPAVFGVLRSRHALVMVHPAVPEATRQAMTKRIRPVAEIGFDDAGLQVRPATGGSAAAVWQAPRSRPDLAIALCVLTSGSTGRPRLIAAPRHQMRTAGRLIQRRLGYRPDDVIAAVSPFSFDFGLYQLLLAAETGARVVVDPSLGTAHGVAAAVARCGVSVLPVVPSMLRLITTSAMTRRVDTRQVRLITTTGDLLTETDVASASDAFPQARIAPMYGLSECKRVAISPEKSARPAGAVGLPLDETDVAIHGRCDLRLAAGSGGELLVAGPHLTLGYLGDPEATALRFQVEMRSGIRILRTGDRLRRDEQGWLYWIGRGSDLIKCSGFRLHPAELESAAADSGFALESAAYGRDDLERGQRPVLVVRLREGAAEANLEDALRERLPTWAVPEIVLRDEPLPRTVNGKIDREALRQSADRSARPASTAAPACTPNQIPFSLAGAPSSRQFLNCHTQALLSTYTLPFDLTSAEFEVFTTTPFGVRAQAEDIHRLLIPYLDPDLGLDRACAVLGLQVEIAWHDVSAGARALAQLDSWLRIGPVLLGPLDLGALSYHETAVTLQGCDHYLVALGRTEDTLIVRDPEGFVHTVLDERSLLTAWAAGRVPEGRGAFSMRRLLFHDVTEADTPKILLANTAYYALNNLVTASRQPGGGPDAYHALTGLRATSAHRRSLSFLLPAATTRYQLAAQFARRFADEETDPHWNEFADLCDEQLITLAMAHHAVLVGEPANSQFDRAATTEQALTDLAMQIIQRPRDRR